MVLKALEIPYTTEFVDFPDMKKEPFVSVNPNGRVPAIEDPNTGVSDPSRVLMNPLEGY